MGVVFCNPGEIVGVVFCNPGEMMVSSFATQEEMEGPSTLYLIAQIFSKPDRTRESVYRIVQLNLSIGSVNRIGKPGLSNGSYNQR